MEKPEISEIAVEIKKGNEVAFAKFFDLYFDRIYGFLKSILRNAEDAEDVTSTAFIYVWDNREKLREPEQLVSWLYQVAKHRAFDLYRKNKGKTTVALDGLENILSDEDTDLERDLDREYLKEKVEGMLDGLSSYERAILHLRFNEDLDFNQIAERLDATSVSIRVRFHRLSKKLKDKNE